MMASTSLGGGGGPWLCTHLPHRFRCLLSSPAHRHGCSFPDSCLPIAHFCRNSIAHYQNSHTQFVFSPNLFSSSCGLLLFFVFSNAHMIGSASAAPFGLAFPGNAGAQVQVLEQPEPLRGNCATCIGVVDETLGACGAILNCVSTFDDRPDFFIAPWEFPGKLPNALEQMERILAEEGGTIEEQGNRYIHVVFTDKDGTIDDVEFLFSIPSEDATVNIRAASRRISSKDYGRNLKRLAKIRQALTWEEVPILRNRNRKLFFLESPWDTFGPEPPPAFDNKDGLEFVPD